MRFIGRVLGYSSLALGVGYGGYISVHTFRSGQEIALRQNSPDFADPRARFAPIKLHGRYVNPFPEYRHQTLYEFLYCRVRELFTFNPRGSVPVDRHVLETMLPTGTPSKEILAGNKVRGFPKPSQRISFTWIGQSCAFVQLPTSKGSPLNILTDPMFSNSVVSPHVGPQRLVPACCGVEDLPTPQVVLVSHDHQDHLDLKAAKLIGNSATWIVPLGVGKHLEKVGISNIVEMDWWTKIPIPHVDPKLGYEVACTPSMHWSGRTLLDANETLWCSFMVLKNDKPVFFHAGDSGYAKQLFEGIAKVYGRGCTLAMVPCGAYTPRWHLRSQHMNPEEALEVMKSLGAKNLVGVHWGTFIMSDEAFLEPKQRLLKGSAMEGLPNVQAPVFGETLVYKV